nr:hypothetical protein [Tanacetum cinerariifolium]
MMLDSIDNGPFVYPTVKENGQTRPKKYSEFTKAQQLQDDCEFQATNIILYSLPPDVYALVNHQEVAKGIWDRVKMLMKGTELSYQERECRLYNLFDKFAYVLGETLYSMYPPPQQFTPVYAAPIHHPHHHTPVNLVNLQQHPVSPLPFISPSMTPQSQTKFPQLDSGLTITIFQQREDPIECINKAMTFLSALASRFPPSNNQLRTSSNPRNQATIQDGIVIVQQVQGRQHQSYADCDDLSSAKAVLMANLSRYDPNVLSEVPYSSSYPNNMINQDVQEMQYFKQTHVDDFEDNEIHSDSQMDDLIHDRNAKLTDFQQDIDTLKETLSNNVKEKESLSQTLTIFKTESKEKESKYIDNEIVLDKQNKELENIIVTPG